MAWSEQIGQKESIFVFYMKPKVEIPDFATAMQARLWFLQSHLTKRKK